MLKLISVATTTGFASLSDADASRSGKPTPDTAQDLDHLADRYQVLYHSTAPAVLMTPVVAHLETLRDLLRQGAAAPQRAVFLADIASVELACGDLDQACATAGDAAEQLGQAGYAIGFGRLRDFRNAVRPWSSSTPVRALDEQLAALG